MKENLEPIPTPKEQLWKEFRVAYLPWIIMALTIGITWVVWTQVAIAPTMMGEVESVRAQVVSPDIGVVEKVAINRFQEVKAGDPLVVIRPTDPRNALNSIQLELSLLNSHGDESTLLSRYRAKLDYYSLRLNILSEQVNLEEAKVELVRTEKDLIRSENLMKEKYLSKEMYDISLAERDKAKETVKQLEESLPILKAKADKMLEGIDSIGEGNSVFEQKLKAIEDKLARISSPDNSITLIAPIDGMVSGVWCSPGEVVTEGYILAAINATQPDRIVGYIRQPFPVEPVPGMSVKIVTHSNRRVLAVTEVDKVGLFLEPITNSLARMTSERPVDMGLPVSFKIPENVSLRPGEVVGLSFTTDP